MNLLWAYGKNNGLKRPMKQFKAYCRYCEQVVEGKTTAVTVLESGNYLYIGECNVCLYEIRRISRQ
jgi:Uri superfamily endonuclease